MDKNDNVLHPTHDVRNYFCLGCARILSSPIGTTSVLLRKPTIAPVSHVRPLPAFTVEFFAAGL
jgi:hypothetical protein